MSRKTYIEAIREGLAEEMRRLAEEGPPKGTLYHYPNPYQHQILSIAGAPAPHKIGEQIYVQGIMTQMAVRYYKGEAMEKTLAWAEGVEYVLTAGLFEVGKRDRSSPTAAWMPSFGSNTWRSSIAMPRPIAVAMAMRMPA